MLHSNWHGLAGYDLFLILLTAIYSMQIPLTVGFSSMQKPFNIDLTSISHLFVSYTEDEQLINLFEDYCNQLKSRGDKGLRFAMAVHSKNKNRLLNILPAYQWIRILNSNNGAEEKTDNKALFIKDVHSELYKRMKNIKKHPTPLPLIIFCDDIIDLGIRNATKQISRQFLLLLLAGPAVNIHLIAGTPFSYRNLMQQITQLQPVKHIKPAKDNLVADLQLTGVCGAELILSAEGLFFYKEKESREYIKLYSLKREHNLVS